MREAFEGQLQQLHQQMEAMGGACEEIIGLASQALTEDSEALHRRVNVVGASIDEMERTVEATCMKLLLRQQPVARDLRAISAALKMITDLERIGDQAEDIVEIVPQMNAQPQGACPQIQEMAQQTMAMVTDSINAYIHDDLALCKSVQAHDDVVDLYFVNIKTGLIDLVAKDPAQGEYALDLLMIAKYFERIGDHATNVAEWVEYSITGAHKS